MGLNRQKFINAVDPPPDAITNNLKLWWDTTNTSGSGSTGNLNAVGSTAITSTDSTIASKDSSSYLDPSGNQAWQMQGNHSQIFSNQVFSHADFMNTTASAYTLEYWVKIDSKEANGSVFANSWGSGGESWIIGLSGASSDTTTGGFDGLFKTASASTLLYGNFGNAAIGYGAWKHYVFTVETTGITSYINGSANGSKVTWSGTPHIGGVVTTIGGRAGYTSLSWNGAFRIHRIYSDILTTAEITNNFDANKAMFGLS